LSFIIAKLLAMALSISSFVLLHVQSGASAKTAADSRH